MASSVKWRAQAREDLFDLLSYISKDNPDAASRYAQDILAATERLGDFPESGRVYASSYRVLVVRHHLVLYRIVDAQRNVLIVNLLDSRRDPDALLLDLNDPH